MNENGINSLIIKSVSPDDGGQYTGRAENKAGHAEFSLIITVMEREYHVPPKFVERIRGVNVCSGQDIVLTCSAQGNPPPKLAWTKDNRFIDNSDKYKWVIVYIILQHLCYYNVYMDIQPQWVDHVDRVYVKALKLLSPPTVPTFI